MWPVSRTRPVFLRARVAQFACFTRMGIGRAASLRLMKPISMRALAGMMNTLAKMNNCIFELLFVFRALPPVLAARQKSVHTYQTRAIALRYKNSFASGNICCPFPFQPAGTRAVSDHIRTGATPVSGKT